MSPATASAALAHLYGQLKQRQDELIEVCMQS